MPIFSIIATLINKKEINRSDNKYLTGDWITPLIELIVMGVPIIFIIFSIQFISIIWTIFLMIVYFIILIYYETKIKHK